LCDEIWTLWLGDWGSFCCSLILVSAYGFEDQMTGVSTDGESQSSRRFLEISAFVVITWQKQMG
jgi:hypothetical protein